MVSGTRTRIVGATAGLMQQQGFAGTGVKQILGVAGAPLGSLYHFFPGGKQQLTAEVLRTGGGYFLQLYLDIVRPAPDLVQGIDAFFSGAKQALTDSGYADACPIATVASEVAGANEELRLVCSEVFESWLDALRTDLAEAGVAEPEVPTLALSLLAMLEGAFLLCRTRQSPEPMEAARSAARLLLSAALHRP